MKTKALIVVLILWASTGFSELALDSSSLQAASVMPNIVFIFADDLGSGDLGCTGHPYAETPNIDRLASEGMRFEQFYVTGITCGPSRTGLMTSRHPASFQRAPGSYGFGDVPTITELLKQHGYTTGHVGKWHIGDPLVATNGIYGIDSVQIIGGNKDKENKGGRDADLFEAAIDFIDQNRDKPFYLNVWGHITHYPVDPHPVLTRRFKHLTVSRDAFGEHMQHKFDKCEELGGDIQTSMRNYLADVWSLDLQVGKLLSRLDELGLADNTIVVFSSDHGPAPVRAKVEKDQRKNSTPLSGRNPSQNMLGYAGGLRGGKHEQYEGGVRSPFIIRWPGKVPAGKTNQSTVISSIDWLPTLCSITGISIDPNHFEGENMMDVWFDGNRIRSTPLFWRTSSSGAQTSIRYKNWKLHQVRKKPPELYDLSNDPEERINLAAKHPETVQELTGLITDWTASLPNEYKKKDDYKKEKRTHTRNARKLNLK